MIRVLGNSRLAFSVLLGLLTLHSYTSCYKFEILQKPVEGARSDAPAVELDNRLLKFISEGYLPYPHRLVLDLSFHDSHDNENSYHELCNYVMNLMLSVERNADVSKLSQKAFFLSSLPDCRINPSAFVNLPSERVPMTFVFLRSSPSLDRFTVNSNYFVQRTNIGISVLSETKFDELKKAAETLNIVADFSIKTEIDPTLQQVEIFSNLNSLKAYNLVMSANHFAQKFRFTKKDKILVRQYPLLGKISGGEGGIDLQNNRYCSPYYGKYCIDLRHYGLVADMDGLMKYIAQIEYQNEMWPGHLKYVWNYLYAEKCLKEQRETLTSCLKGTYDELPSKVNSRMANRIDMITGAENKQIFTSLLANTYAQLEKYHLTEEYATMPSSVVVIIDGERIYGNLTPDYLLKILCHLRDEEEGICSPNIIYHSKIDSTVPQYPYKNTTVFFTLILTVAVVLYTVS
jgi:hypothetical protein